MSLKTCLYLELFKNLSGDLWVYSAKVRVSLVDCGESFEGVNGLVTKLSMLLQNHWDAVYQESRLTGVWHCPERPGTDLRPDPGVVSFENLHCSQWFPLWTWSFGSKPPNLLFSKLHGRYQIQPSLRTTNVCPFSSLRTSGKNKCRAGTGTCWRPPWPQPACRCVPLIPGNAFSKHLS